MIIKLYYLLILILIILIIKFFHKSQKKENLGYLHKEELNSNIFVPVEEYSEYFFENIDFEQAFFQFTGLDYLGRTGIANAVIDKVMINTLSPKKYKRHEYISYKPTGYNQKEYQSIENSYLYNRCHLIGYQLIGNNDYRNLITGTRDFNVKGMLPIENAIYEFIKNEDGIVKYEVIPDFRKEELVARGVYIKAIGLANKEVKLKINVYVKNIQEGIKIDYKTGISRKER